MTWTLASFHMYNGAAIYRPHWKHNENIRAVRKDDHFIAYRFVDNKPDGLWIADPADLVATDWECEEFIVLASDDRKAVGTIHKTIKEE
ncbi:MAG: hypothetical protein IJ874_09210 [Ruminococcus sp.]|nr:hypothetical protein [Ruminococcus sp.]